MGKPVVFFEIGCDDRAKTSSFYSQLFDWNITDTGMSAEINTGSDMGIAGHFVSLGHDPHQYVTVYVQVEDVAATLAQAVALGGKTIVPPVDIPPGTFAWISDPEGNMIGLWKPRG